MPLNTNKLNATFNEFLQSIRQPISQLIDKIPKTTAWFVKNNMIVLQGHEIKVESDYFSLLEKMHQIMDLFIKHNINISSNWQGLMHIAHINLALLAYTIEADLTLPISYQQPLRLSLKSNNNLSNLDTVAFLILALAREPEQNPYKILQQYLQPLIKINHYFTYAGRDTITLNNMPLGLFEIPLTLHACCFLLTTIEPIANDEQFLALIYPHYTNYFKDQKSIENYLEQFSDFMLLLPTKYPDISRQHKHTLRYDVAPKLIRCNNIILDLLADQNLDEDSDSTEDLDEDFDYTVELNDHNENNAMALEQIGRNPYILLRPLNYSPTNNNQNLLMDKLKCHESLGFIYH